MTAGADTFSRAKRASTSADHAIRRPVPTSPSYLIVREKKSVVEALAVSELIDQSPSNRRGGRVDMGTGPGVGVSTVSGVLNSGVSK